MAKEKQLAYDTDTQRKQRGRDLLLPFSQRDAHGTMPGMLSQRIQSDALDALGRMMKRSEIDRERAQKARRFAKLSRQAAKVTA